MPYIAPLSETTLKKKYAQLGLSEAQLNEIDVLFKACANLYGTKQLDEIWQVYKEAASKQLMETFHRKDLYAFANIAMRDDSKPYRIFEINEIFEDEIPSESNRILVLKDFIGIGYGKFRIVYNLDEKQCDKPPFVPEDIRLWVTPQYLNQGKKLIDYLGSLKVNCKEGCYGFYNEKIKTEHYGECLKDFSYIPLLNRQSLEYYKEKKKLTKVDLRIMRDLSRKDTKNEAEALVKKFYCYSDLYRTYSPSENIKTLFEELDEVGVSLTEAQVKKLLDLAMEYVNNFNHCSNNGWAPVDLAKNMGRKGPMHMTIGPGIQNSIDAGDIDADELREQMLLMGIIPEF